MITIRHTNHTSGMSFAVLMVTTKVKLLDISRKLDLYVSPNLKKEVTAQRLAEEILNNPLAVLCSLCKSELQLVHEFVQTGPKVYHPQDA